MDLLSIILVIVYLMVTGYLGYLGYRQTKTAADYLVAGRNANPWSWRCPTAPRSSAPRPSSASAASRPTSAWGAVADGAEHLVGIFIAFVFLGNPTRRMGHHLDAHTFPELMGKRYDSRFVQVLCALIIFCFMPLYAMAVMVGGAEFIGPIFHISYDAALYLFAVIVAAYVIAGGMKGVMLTDALQGAIMLVGMVFLLAPPTPSSAASRRRMPALGAMADQVPASLPPSATRAGRRCRSSASRPGAAAAEAAQVPPVVDRWSRPSSWAWASACSPSRSSSCAS
jgi:Na+/proline symporter